MTLSERSVGSVTVLDVVGDVKLDEGAGQLRDKVRSLLQQGKTSLLVNLGAVPYIDSAGLGELVQAYAVAKKQGGALKLVERHETSAGSPGDHQAGHRVRDV